VAYSLAIFFVAVIVGIHYSTMFVFDAEESFIFEEEEAEVLTLKLT
jgi:hypothetical protein